ncbi:MAG: DUF1588 domain-containing protein [Planctomycetota bacterium]
MLLAVVLGIAPIPIAAEDVVFETLKAHCIDCHDTGTAEGGFDLTKLETDRGLLIRFRQAERVVEHLRGGTMPPDGPTMSRDEIAIVRAAIQDRIARANWESLRESVPAAPLRLSRGEYTRAIEDVLGVTVNLTDLIPEEPVGGSGFDNDRLSRTISGQDVSMWFQAAERSVETLWSLRASTWKTSVQAETAKHLTIAGTNSVQSLDDGTEGFRYSRARGVKYQQVSKFVEIPVTGNYRVTLKAATIGNGAAGFWLAVDTVGNAQDRHFVPVSNNKLADYSVDVFLTAGQHEIIIGCDPNLPPWLPPVPEQPQRKLPRDRDGVIRKFYDSLNIQPVRWEELRQLPGFTRPADKQAAMDIVDEINRVLLDESIQVFQLFNLYIDHHFLPVNRPQGFRKPTRGEQKRLAMMIGVDVDAIDQLWRSHEPSQHIANEQRATILYDRWHQYNGDRNSAVADLFLDQFTIEGPTSASSRSQRVIDAADVGVDRLLAAVVPRAFRRPIAEADIRQFRDIFQQEVHAGVDDQTAMRRTLIAVLMSPNFLFVRPTGNPELDRGTFWSLTLWRTPVAVGLPTGELQDAPEDESIEGDQLDRMIDDPRTIRMVRDFTTQWLGMDSLGREKSPDSELFREFSWHLAEDMRNEVALQFQHLLRHDLSLQRLLDSDVTFANERLARLYGIDDVKGTEFRPVRWTDPLRRGLLGTAGVLTATSLGARTSPVQRGKFVIETLLGEDLPPPPEDAGSLPDDAGNLIELGLREQLARHRDKVSCAGCHKRIDPMGFALEAFDYAGRRRDRTASGPVDDSATLPDGTIIDGADRLAEYLKRDRGDDFVDHLTRRFATYVAGRELDHRDEATIRAIIKNVRLRDDSARAMVKEVLRSPLAQPHWTTQRK